MKNEMNKIKIFTWKTSLNEFYVVVRGNKDVMNEEDILP